MSEGRGTRETVLFNLSIKLIFIVTFKTYIELAGVFSVSPLRDDLQQAEEVVGGDGLQLLLPGAGPLAQGGVQVVPGRHQPAHLLLSAGQILTPRTFYRALRECYWKLLVITVNVLSPEILPVNLLNKNINKRIEFNKKIPCLL